MPNLTHLAVSPSKRFGSLSDTPPGPSYLDCPLVLESENAPVFQMVVITADMDTEWRPLRELQTLFAEVNERLYVIHAPCRIHHIRATWEKAARGGESIWNRAARERHEARAIDVG
jgi:hypothetical protein